MTDSQILQDDLRDMLCALGMGDHARPQSPHEVFRECIARASRHRAALTEIGEMGPHTAAWSAQTVARVALTAAERKR